MLSNSTYLEAKTKAPPVPKDAPKPLELSPAEIKGIKAELDRAMFKLYRDFPFWAFLLERCSIHISTKIPTACVDKYARITFNPKFMLSLRSEQLQFVMAHEVMHLVLDHLNRFKSRNMALWNIATDAHINEFLDEQFNDPMCYIADGIDKEYIDEVTKGETAGMSITETTSEALYDILLKHIKNPEEQAEASEAKDLDPNGDVLGPEGDDQGQPDPFSSEVRSNTEETPDNPKEWKEAASDAFTRSKMCGKGSGSLERLVGNMVKPVIPWVEIFSHYVKTRFCQGGKERTTFSPPNRRWPDADFILPSRTGKKRPKVAFCVDTSGSMAPAEISRGISELDAIRKLYKVDVYFIESDYDIGRARWVTPWQPLPEVRGGGGTDFAPAIALIQKNRVDIDLLIYFTDGYGNFGKPPDFDTLWVMTTEVKAPFGDTIHMKDYAC